MRTGQLEGRVHRRPVGNHRPRDRHESAGRRRRAHGRRPASQRMRALYDAASPQFDENLRPREREKGLFNREFNSSSVQQICWPSEMIFFVGPQIEFIDNILFLQTLITATTCIEQCFKIRQTLYCCNQPNLDADGSITDFDLSV